MVSIGELATRFGLRASALRYYERRGLLAPTARTGGRRSYDHESIGRLAFIGMTQEAGLSLDEIGLLLTAHGPASRKIITRRLRIIEAQIAQAEHAKALLEQALSCPADHPLERCPYVQAEIGRRLRAADLVEPTTPTADRNEGFQLNVSPPPARAGFVAEGTQAEKRTVSP